MIFKIRTTGGVNVVTCPNEARDMIRHYKQAGIYVGMNFLPWVGK